MMSPVAVKTRGRQVLPSQRKDGGAVAYANIRSVYELRVRGVPQAPLSLPFNTDLRDAEITREGSEARSSDAGIHRTGSQDVAFYAREAGLYTVRLEGTLAVTDPLEPEFRWPPASAARDTIRVDLPADAEWQADGVPLLERTERTEPTETTRDGSRRQSLRFAGTEKTFVLRLEGEQATRDALVRSTLVTIADLDADGLRLQDAVVYRVLRGAIAEHRVVLPAGRRLQRQIFTDEGEHRADPSVAEVHIARERLLGPGAGTAEIGHVLLPYETVTLGDPASAGSATRVLIPAPQLDPEPRARYLVLGSTVAAEMLPQPQNAWRRVDLDDLPDALRHVVAAVAPSSVWQQRDESAMDESAMDVSLDVRKLPPADTLDGLVWLRETNTVLTVDGSLVHHDVFEAQVSGSYLAVQLLRFRSAPPSQRPSSLVLKRLWSTPGPTTIAKGDRTENRASWCRTKPRKCSSTTSKEP